MMHIVLIEPNLSDNGALRVSLNRALHWQRSGAEVTLAVVNGSPPRSRSVSIPPDLPVVFGTARPATGNAVISLVTRLLGRAARADVIVGGREIHSGLLAASTLTRLVRRPLAVTVHSNVPAALQHYVPRRQRELSRWALRAADLAVCVSAGLAAGVEHVGVRRDRIRVVPNGIDAPMLRALAAERPSIPLPAGPFIAAVGRLHDQKGFDVLIRAHALALRMGAPRHSLLIMGEGGRRSALEQLASEQGVRSTVLLPGFVDNPHAVVARSALFALPSRWEGFSLALLEALALAVPAVAADCVAGPAELLRDGAFGRLLPTEDVHALAGAIRDHLLEPEPLRARAREGARHAVARYAADRQALLHLDLLAELAAGRRRRAA